MLEDSAPVPKNPRDALERVREAGGRISRVVRGHPRAVDRVLAAILARGHVLLEDVPGVGKTTLAKAVAQVLGHSFSRIQFTSDLLPADVLGVQVFDRDTHEFRFKPGPLFARVVLADEINRASPKTQSSMLEAMAEGGITIDDRRFPLPQPFVVIATQNPVEHHGAYPLPESQLDRFAISLSLGYPGRHHEKALLLEPSSPQRELARNEPVLTPSSMTEIQSMVDRVTLADTVADYLLTVVERTRNHPQIGLGCSPRGALILAALTRSWAFLQGRDFVIPDDVKALAVPALAHRIMVENSNSTGTGADSTRASAISVIEEILQQVPAPR